MSVAAVAVLMLAQWATWQMAETRAAQKARDELVSALSDALRTRAMLRAEWKYLNRPDRLRALADLNADTLNLMPLGPDHFGEIDQIAFPERGGLTGLGPSVDAARRAGDRP